MKAAVVMPCYGSLDWVEPARVSLWDGRGKLDINMIMINNGDAETVEYLKNHQHVTAINNETNLGISVAWNQGLRVALASDAEVIILANSDIVASATWGDALVEAMEKYSGLYFLASGCAREELNNGSDGGLIPGRAGWFLALPRELARLVYPIPEELFIWYGDDYIHETAIDNGWQCAVIPRMRIFHQGSVGVFRLPNYTDRIAQDKIEWQRIAEARGWTSARNETKRIVNMLCAVLPSNTLPAIRAIVSALAFEIKRTAK